MNPDFTLKTPDEYLADALVYFEGATPATVDALVALIRSTAEGSVVTSNVPLLRAAIDNAKIAHPELFGLPAVVDTAPPSEASSK